MKLKKFFAGVLAAAMMLTVVATAAFATAPTPATGETDNNAVTYTPSETNVDLGIKKNYKVEKGTAPKENFTFSVTYVPGKSKPYTTAYTGYDGTYKQPKASETATASFESNMDAQARAYQASLGIKISDFELPDGPGKYCFEIKENVPTNKTPGVTYDETTRYLVITVANNDALNGYVYYAQLFDSNYGNDNDLNAHKVPGDEAFTNTYTANNVVISKDIKGGFADLAAKFTFKVKLTYANGKTATQYVGAKVTEYTGETAEVRNQVWAIDGTTEHTISLGRNQSITLTNLPEGVTVTVEETDGGEYTVTKSDDTTGTLENSTITATISKVNDTLVDGKIGFINTKEGTPDMGVILDNAPYIALLAIVAIGGVALMLNKRRRDEE